MAVNLDKLDPEIAEYKQLLSINAAVQQKLDKKFRLEFNYNSNHIEGNTLTYGETQLLLIFDNTTGNHLLREYEEMKGHDVAYKLVQDLAADKDRPLTEQFIKELNRIVLVKPFYKNAVTQDGAHASRQILVGDYKQQPNSAILSNGAMFHYASPAETPAEMHKMLDWYRAHENKMHPVALAALLHYKFVRIHPFDDGNGRISRLLLNYVLLKNQLPPVIIKSADKSNYLYALHQADTGNEDAFISYIADQLSWSLQLAITAAGGGDISEQNDFDKELELLKRKAEAKPKRDIGEQKMRVMQKVFVPLKDRLSEGLESSRKFFNGRSEWSGLYEDINRGLKYVVDDAHLLKPDESMQARIRIAEAVGYTYRASVPKMHDFETKDWQVDLNIHFMPAVYEIKIAGLSYAYPYSAMPGEDDLQEMVQAARQDFLAMLHNNIND